MKKKRITVISFLVSDKRYFIEATASGTFKIPVMENINGKYKKTYKYLTPREVISDPRIKDGDPSLTLETGEKIRVVQGGDSTYMLVEADSALFLHEKLLSENAEKKKRESLKETQPINYNQEDFDFSYGYDDDW